MGSQKRKKRKHRATISDLKYDKLTELVSFISKEEKAQTLNSFKEV